MTEFQDAYHENKRSADRMQTKDAFQVEFRLQKKAGTFNKGYSSDLSLTGLRFTTIARLEKGTMIDLVLKFSPLYHGMNPMTVPAEVVRVDIERGKLYRKVACRFDIQNSQELKQALKDFMTWARGQHPQVEESALSNKEEALVIKPAGKRWAKRIAAHDAYQAEFSMDYKTYRGFGWDLSETGAKFTAYENPGMNKEILLILSLTPQFPGPKKIEIKSLIIESIKVADQSHWMVRCQFRDGQDITQTIVRQFLAWLDLQKSN